MAKNERTLQMLRNFMRLHEKGLSIDEIAKKYDLSSGTVYAYLQEIADANGVTRESLLQRPHSEHLCYEREFEPVKPIDLTDFHKHFDAALTEIDAARSALDQEIVKQEEFAQEVNERMELWNSRQ